MAKYCQWHGQSCLHCAGKKPKERGRKSEWLSYFYVFQLRHCPFLTYRLVSVHNQHAVRIHAWIWAALLFDGGGEDVVDPSYLT